ncbi:hypothetical protein F5887DRAFT_1077038 [Amanita rubescens]|nr:hypothetical protein F5887DRAFT_1077038 [Amanita rubescens]
MSHMAVSSLQHFSLTARHQFTSHPSTISSGSQTLGRKVSILGFGIPSSIRLRTLGGASTASSGTSGIMMVIIIQAENQRQSSQETLQSEDFSTAPSPFSDDEAKAEQLNFKTAPPVGAGSAPSSDAATNSTHIVPPPPPPWTRSKSLAPVNDSPSSPIPSSSSFNPPLRTRRPNAAPTSDPGPSAPTSAILQTPPPRISNRTSQPSPQFPSRSRT